MNLFNSTLFQVLVVHTMLPCFLVTEIVECTAAVIYPGRNLRDTVLVFFVNMATNPAAVFLNFMLPFRIAFPVLWTLFLECAIWLIEAAIYKRFLNHKRNVLLFSFVLNAASYGIGLFI
ncbi:MAG: hypothetical protein ACI4JN_12505 [Ruminococcus sp.]